MLLTPLVTLLGLAASRAVPEYSGSTKAVAPLQKPFEITLDTPAAEIQQHAADEINNITFVDKVRHDFTKAKADRIDTLLEKIQENELRDNEFPDFVIVDSLTEAEKIVVGQIEKMMRDSQLKRKEEIKNAGSRWGLGWLSRLKNWILKHAGSVIGNRVKAGLCTYAQVQYGVPFFVSDYIIQTVAEKTASVISQQISSSEGLQTKDFSFQDIFEYVVFKLDRAVQARIPETKVSRNADTCQVISQA